MILFFAAGVEIGNICFRWMWNMFESITPKEWDKLLLFTVVCADRGFFELVFMLKYMPKSRPMV